MDHQLKNMTTDPRFYLVISMALMAATALWLMQIARRFRYNTRGGEAMPFTILDIQFPASEAEMDGMVRGMEPTAQRALKTHLWVDFLFMAGFYPAVALLCVIVGAKTGVGEYFFWLVGALQAVAWLADICENVYCLRKLRPKPVTGGFKSYAMAVNIKFVLAFLGLAVTLPLVFYFWMTGEFRHSSVAYAGILTGEILIFLLIALYNISRRQSSTP